ncbi:DUF1800 domain-containing protein [Sediminibacterium ginsengisoli]|uniref:Uncharacterized conserved protein, DUF1800 family n=1 Tax=Sediminibacterium ginsengisoli TaxID=413434 RepID=A0A1T4NLU1_9BACT|nr:DUF1800 domain-containing protein [Sediminibacterium ginsengisoli]SJZ80250.1 Uncharacterized conserved protein, DUF1800 family [Sediminibacterium ginsengisoli]
MKISLLYKSLAVGLIITLFSAFSVMQEDNGAAKDPKISLPYKKMGLTKKQAAAHLLSRFTFGARPGEIDKVADMGLEKWLEQQFDGTLDDAVLAEKLKGYDALQIDNDSIVNTYLNNGQVIRVGIRKGLINKDSVQAAGRKEYQDKLLAVMKQEGYKPIAELQRQLINQKVIRAAYSENQLKEILTDFWFNHFNVSLTKNQSEQFIMTYERDAIRPYVTGNFQDMLVATAKHPAMLEYLDNATSISNNNDAGKKQEANAKAQLERKRRQAEKDTSSRIANEMMAMEQAMNNQKRQGLNENYAREIMELHTLGVDGGYTQNDVTEVARALTGWAPRPMFNDGVAKKQLDRLGDDKMAKQGIITEGDFLFRGNKHDEGEKMILGHRFPANGGYKEGMQVLELLANYPATAKFISTKLATRFVSDTPSTALVKEMAETFLATKGNLKAVMITMVNSKEFWAKSALREKVKSPFEFAISAVRATNADVQQPFQIYTWCMKMGQRFYYYQAPTGFPDRAAYWINTGSLLNRMNFGLAFATEKIPGVKLNLIALNNGHEPESPDEALAIYSRILLPERNQEENIKRLTALVRDANVEKKINDAAAKNTAPVPAGDMQGNDMMAMNNDTGTGKGKKQKAKTALNKKATDPRMTYAAGNNTALSQVAGIIIGSPEFQRK